jgi:collagen type I alpha
MGAGRAVGTGGGGAGGAGAAAWISIVPMRTSTEVDFSGVATRAGSGWVVTGIGASAERSGAATGAAALGACGAGPTRASTSPVGPGTMLGVANPLSGGRATATGGSGTSGANATGSAGTGRASSARKNSAAGGRGAGKAAVAAGAIGAADATGDRRTTGRDGAAATGATARGLVAEGGVRPEPAAGRLPAIGVAGDGTGDTDLAGGLGALARGRDD